MAFFAIAFSLVAAFGAAAPTQALAATGGEELAAGNVQTTAASVKLSDGLELWAGNPRETELYNYINYSGDDPLTITKVVSSNSSVLKVKKLDSDKSVWSYNVYPIKAGKAKLSVTYKLKGKTKTISKTFTVKAFTDGVESITLNGENLPIPTSTKGLTELNMYEFKGTSVTLDVATANGWAIESVNGYMSKKSGSGSKDFNVTLGKPFAMSKNYEGTIDIYLFKESTDEYFFYRINLNRDKAIKLAKDTFFVGRPKYNMMPYDTITGGSENIEVVDVVSSKPSVLKPVSNKNFEKVKLQAKKAGKSKVTLIYKIDGRSYSVSTTCTVVNYPLKSVKLNGKAINLSKNYHGYYVKSFKKGNATVKFAPAKGWKVVKTYYYKSGDKVKTVKNGASVSTPSNKYVYVAATLKKGKVSFSYFVNLNTKNAEVYED